MKKLVIIITEDVAETGGKITTREYVGDKSLIDEEIRWCLDEVAKNFNKKI